MVPRLGDDMGLVAGNDVSGRAGCRICNDLIIKGQPAVFVVAGSYRTTYYIHSDPQDCSQQRQDLERGVDMMRSESFGAMMMPKRYLMICVN